MPCKLTFLTLDDQEYVVSEAACHIPWIRAQTPISTHFLGHNFKQVLPLNRWPLPSSLTFLKVDTMKTCYNCHFIYNFSNFNYSRISIVSKTLMKQLIYLNVKSVTFSLKIGRKERNLLANSNFMAWGSWKTFLSTTTYLCLLLNKWAHLDNFKLNFNIPMSCLVSRIEILFCWSPLLFSSQTIFKNGDDLRQDQLILQIIRLMDKVCTIAVYY